MTDPREAGLGKGRVELTDEARRGFEELIAAQTVIINEVDGIKGIKVETIPPQQGKRFYGAVDLRTGSVASDVPGQKVTGEFLQWAREKTAWKPTTPSPRSYPVFPPIE